MAESGVCRVEEAESFTGCQPYCPVSREMAAAYFAVCVTALEGEAGGGVAQKKDIELIVQPDSFIRPAYDKEVGAGLVRRIKIQLAAGAGPDIISVDLV